MIHRLGLQTFEFQLGSQEPSDGSLLFFTSSEDALGWVKHLEFRDPKLLLRLRKYVAQHWADPETYRTTDHSALHRLADLLYLRRLAVIRRDQPASAGDPQSAASTPPAFPLSERTQRTASETSRAPAPEAATFGPNADAGAQAAALVAAAADGTPFCEECEKAKAAAAKGND